MFVHRRSKDSLMFNIIFLGFLKKKKRKTLGERITVERKGAKCEIRDLKALILININNQIQFIFYESSSLLQPDC